MPESSWQTQVLDPSPQALAHAVDLILAGEVVALPSETVYGLAADARRDQAVGQIYAAKGRPSFNPLIVHVPRDCGTLDALAALGVIDLALLPTSLQPTAQRLMDLFWPGPLTLVLPKGRAVCSRASGGLETVAVRMPHHPIFQQILDWSRIPLAAPSANRSKRISPTTAHHVLAELEGRIPLILNGGPAAVGVESTIVALREDGRLRLLRPGGLAVERIMDEARVIFDDTVSNEKKGEDGSGRSAGAPVIAPGMLLEHYAPKTPMVLLNPEESEVLAKCLRRDPWAHRTDLRIGFLVFSAEDHRGSGQARIPEPWLKVLGERPRVVRSLSTSPDGEAAARGLFAALRSLDEDPDLTLIVAQRPAGEGGLWPAILDRLTRAANGAAR